MGDARLLAREVVVALLPFGRPFDGVTWTAVTLYSGQLVAQSEYSVVTTLAWVPG